MKREGWIRFLIGIVFCLLMVLPTSGQASLFIDGDYTTYGVVGLNYENSPGGSGYFWDGTLTKDAYINANTYLDGLAVNSSGWRIFNDGGEVYNGSSYSGLIFGYPYNLISGSLYNNSGYIEGSNGVKMGAGTVTNSGGIYGNNGDGIYQYSEGASTFTVTNGVYIPLTVVIDPDTYVMTITTGTPTVTGIGTIAGYNGGIYSYIGGAGAATVDNAGLIEGGYGAGVGLYGNGASTATVTNTGTIYGGSYGGGYAGVDIDGVLTATVTNSGTIDGDSEGVRIGYTDTATVTNNSGATISGQEGVDFYEVGDVTVDNSGSIRGQYGVDVNHADTVNITNKSGGTIRGQYGINIDDADAVDITNAGSIRGQYGIYIDDSGDVKITNNDGGSIRGQYGVYVENTDSAEVINNAGGTISGEYGIYMRNITGADTATVTNSGIIDGDEEGVHIGYSDTAEVTNNAGGSINGYEGVDFYEVGDITVTNSGEIGGRYGVDVNHADTVEITNNEGGEIHGQYGIDIDDVETVTVTNSGEISGQYGVYIEYVEDSAEVINNAGGSIHGQYGVFMQYVGGEDTAKVTNSGDISGQFGVTIHYVDAAEVTNNASGTITGGWNAVDIEYVLTDATLSNAGTITGYGGYGYDGEDGDYYGYGYGYDGDWGFGGFGGYGVLAYQVMGAANITNTGTITGYGAAGIGGNGGTGDDYYFESSGDGGYGGMGMGAWLGLGISVSGVDSAFVENSGTVTGYGGDGYGGNGGDWNGSYYGYSGSGGDGGDGMGGFIGGMGIGITEVTGLAEVVNSGTVTGYGGNGIGGYGGNGSYNYDDDDDDYVGGDGGWGFGGSGYGVSIVNVGSAKVTNSSALTINGIGGNGVGGNSGVVYYSDDDDDISGDGGSGVGAAGYGVFITNWVDGFGPLDDDDDMVTPMETAMVINSGIINGTGGNGIGGDGYYGGIGFGAEGYGVYIDNAQTVTVDNSGTINGIGGDGYGGMGEYGNSGFGYGGSGYGVYVANAETATVNNIGGTISGHSGNSDFSLDNYYDDDDDSMPQIKVTLDDDDDSSAGIFIEWTPDVTVNNIGGTISGTHESSGFSAYSDAYGIYINSPWYSDTDTATIISGSDITASATSYGYTEYAGAYATGVYIDDADRVTVLNGATVDGEGVITVTGGTISATAFAQGDEYGAYADAEGMYIEEAFTEVAVTNFGDITGTATAHGDMPWGSETVPDYDDGDAYAYSGGVSIEHTAAATVDNMGGTISGTATANGYYAYADGWGVWIDSLYHEVGDTATVNNTGTISGTATAHGYYEYGEAYGSGVWIDDASTVNVLNGAYVDEEENLIITGGTISSTANGYSYADDGAVGYSYAYGVYIEDAETATVTNYGTISGTGTGYGYNGNGGCGKGYGYGVYMTDIFAERTATVTNIGGTINGKGTGLSEGAGYGDGYGYGIYMSNVGAAVVTNGAIEDEGTPEEVITGGTISGEGVAYNEGYGDGYGIYIYDADTIDITNYGTIIGTGTVCTDCTSYSRGIYIDKPGSYDDDDAVHIYNRGTISGNVGIYSDGYTTIENYGTITSTDAEGNYYAVELDDGYNNVLLGTGSVVNGLIIADYDDLSYTNNFITLDAAGAADVNTMAANQILGFDTMEKTGAGTWVLTGDMDYTDPTYNETESMPVTVTDGVLAFGARETTAGVTTDYLTVADGASIGYVITPEGDTGAVTVTEDADFGSGTVYVYPTPTNANLYDLTTTYEEVLTVGGTIYNQWTDVTTDLAFLTAELVEDGTNIYDLILHRLSFTTGADESTTPLGQLLDELYGSTDDPELLALLNDLLTQVSEGEAGQALAELSGGSHTAFQLLSFNGLDKYLGILNNHMGGMGGFAGYNSGIGLAFNENGTQLAMAGSGETISDVAPMMLAAVGNVISQGQAARGTNWGLWADGYLGTGNRRSDELIAKYKQNLFGGIIGFDYRIADDLFIGISGGISRTNVEFDDLLDKGHMDSYHGSLYLCYNGKPWYAAGVFTYAYNKYNLDRYITTLGPTMIANSDYSGNEYTGYAEVGYKISAGNVEIRPLAAFQVDYLEQESFTETGAGIYNLYVEKQETGSYKSFLGVNVTGNIKLSETAALRPEFRLKWAHEFSNDDHMINASFDGMGSSSFVVEAETLSRDTAIIGVGMSLLFNKHVSAYIQYDAELNSDFVNHTGLLGLRLAW